MTLESTNAKNSFTGDGVQTVFPFTLKVWETSEIVVLVDNVTQVHESVVVISINPDKKGGTITFVSAAPALGAKGLILRATEQKQESSWPLRGKLDTRELESTLDKIVAMIQDNTRDIEDRTFRWRGDWSSTETYQVGEAVAFNGSTYISITENLNSEPPSDDWEAVAIKGDSGGLTWTGAWSDATSYAAGAGVSHESSSYIAIFSNTNSEPPSANWHLLAERGQDGDVSGPVSSTDKALVLWDGTGGSNVEDSGIAPSVPNATKLVGISEDGSSFSLFDQPGGGLPSCSESVRLTLESGVPVSSTDQTAKSTLFCTAGLVKLWDGSKWKVYERAQLSKDLSALLANTAYAVYEYLDDGTPTLELQAWASGTARTTLLTKDATTGIIHKTGDKTRVHRGDILTTGTPGECEDSRKFRGVWNQCNRRPRPVRAFDDTNSWSYLTLDWRAWNGGTTLGVGQVKVMSGDPSTFARLRVCGSHATSHVNEGGKVGIGINSTTATSAQITNAVMGNSTAFGTTPSAEYQGSLPEQVNSIYPIEFGTSSSSTFFGDNNSIIQNGLSGEVWM